jgi:hypothetical protein
MTKINKILILAVSVIALVALAGVASAAVTYKVESITRNGYYIGVPTLIAGDFNQYGYTYTFVFDGTYTISGYATNDGPVPVDVWVDAFSYSSSDWNIDKFTVPAADSFKPGKASFSVKIRSPDSNFDSYAGLAGDPGNKISYEGVDIVDAVDNQAHTVDQGPMSDATAIFVNGKVTYKGSPLYSVV